jgi:hypothetical protein
VFLLIELLGNCFYFLNLLGVSGFIDGIVSKMLLFLEFCGGLGFYFLNLLEVRGFGDWIVDKLLLFVESAGEVLVKMQDCEFHKHFVY